MSLHSRSKDAPSRWRQVPLLAGLGLTIALLLAAQAPAHARASYSAFVVDAVNGNVLYERRANKQRPPASLAKMMTLYLLFEALEAGTVTLDTRWTASSRAQAQPPSELGLRRGAKLTVRDAIGALVTKSANDVATVVAEGLAGTEWQFARLMTAKARELGMRHTVFANASGLPNRDMVSTARDMSVLALRLRVDFPRRYEVFSTRSFSYRGQAYGNHNKLLGHLGVDGVKTGYTRAAGWNLAASAFRNGRRIVAVLMGGRSRIWRDNRMRELLGDGFAIAARRDVTVPRPGFHPLRGAGTTMASGTANGVPAPLPEAHPRRHDGALARLDGRASRSTEAAPAMAQGSIEDLPWAIQVGAFSRFAGADSALKRARGHLDPVVGRQVTSVVSASHASGSTLYRARYVNLTQSQARRGCEVLRARELPCAVVRYGP